MYLVPIFSVNPSTYKVHTKYNELIELNIFPCMVQTHDLIDMYIYIYIYQFHKKKHLEQKQTCGAYV